MTKIAGGLRISSASACVPRVGGQTQRLSPRLPPAPPGPAAPRCGGHRGVHHSTGAHHKPSACSTSSPASLSRVSATLPSSAMRWLRRPHTRGTQPQRVATIASSLTISAFQPPPRADSKKTYPAPFFLRVLTSRSPRISAHISARIAPSCKDVGAGPKISTTLYE